MRKLRSVEIKMILRRDSRVVPDIDLNLALVSGVVHFLINHSVSQKVILIAWYCTEICELFISVGSRFCAGYVNWITVYSVTYGDITEEPAVVDK